MLTTALEFSLAHPPEWLRSIGKVVVIGVVLIWVLNTMTRSSSRHRDDHRDHRD